MLRTEVSVAGGTGKPKPAGGGAGAINESINRAFSHLLANMATYGVAREVDTSDLHAEVLDLLENKTDAGIGVAFFIAAFSALR